MLDPFFLEEKILYQKEIVFRNSKLYWYKFTTIVEYILLLFFCIERIEKPSKLWFCMICEFLSHPNKKIPRNMTYFSKKSLILSCLFQLNDKCFHFHALRMLKWQISIKFSFIATNKISTNTLFFIDYHFSCIERIRNCLLSCNSIKRQFKTNFYEIICGN